MIRACKIDIAAQFCYGWIFFAKLRCCFYYVETCCAQLRTGMFKCCSKVTRKYKPVADSVFFMLYISVSGYSDNYVLNIC